MEKLAWLNPFCIDRCIIAGLLLYLLGSCEGEEDGAGGHELLCCLIDLTTRGIVDNFAYCICWRTMVNSHITTPLRSIHIQRLPVPRCALPTCTCAVDERASS